MRRPCATGYGTAVSSGRVQFGSVEFCCGGSGELRPVKLRFDL